MDSAKKTWETHVQEATEKLGAGGDAKELDMLRADLARRLETAHERALADARQLAEDAARLARRLEEEDWCRLPRQRVPRSGANHARGAPRARECARGLRYCAPGPESRDHAARAGWLEEERVKGRKRAGREKREPLRDTGRIEGALSERLDALVEFYGLEVVASALAAGCDREAALSRGLLARGASAASQRRSANSPRTRGRSSTRDSPPRASGSSGRRPASFPGPSTRCGGATPAPTR